ncbi:TonB-dependent receptor [Fulvivirga ulvae]|uniref:TonB-dependent receptor n=1 Tax=Fulvivirga ulvae TaxID=2904245 RepID=UPI001F19D02A|nr:TonB-dependent receptor [Fulvivirga ulvae]UII29599.1 TonB-dependent receptor [Fulvivirga ulvae]
MKHIILANFIFLLSGNIILAQQKHTISGTIKDVATGETMIGVSIYVQELKAGASCNAYGFYSLTLPEGEYHIVYSFIGYESDTAFVILNKNIKIDRDLSEITTELSEVVITAEKKDDNIRNTDIGVDKIDVKEVEKIPVVFGERDILKTIQLMPGVKSAGEGNSGFFVRGGSADQNLILLDEAPVYNASHLLGFFSTFNSDALKDVTIIKGNSPAQYGGRLSSVLDVKMKEGNNQKYSVAGGLGLISSRLSIEGPIQKGKSSFIVSGRRTYADLFLQASEDFEDNSLYFYDLNAKANIWVNDKNRIFVSGYFGKDVLGFGDNFGIDWGNTTGTIRWNSLISPKLFSNTSIIYSDYDSNIELNSDGSDFNINSNIEDWNLKQEFQYFLNSKNNLQFGFNSIYHTITPTRFEGDSLVQEEQQSRSSLENSIFISNSSKFSSRFTMDYGLRLSFYSILGGDTYYRYDQGVLTDSVVLASDEIGKTYYNFEPRLQFSYLLNKVSSIKVGYARNTQHLHLLSNSTSTSPTDQWIGNSYNIKPEISDQISIGYFRNFDDNKYQMSMEGYYKDLQNQVDYRNGADITSTTDVERELLYGTGRAYGAEFLIKKTAGTLTGWIGYTLSRTERKIDGINDNNWYPARQDRTHDLSVVTMYELSKRWTLSALFVYNTGNAVTFPSGKYNVEGNTVFYYTERNGYRMPAYHRMDFGATYTRPHKNKKFESSWNFSLYNVYGRQNAYTITFEDHPDDPTRTRALQTALFRWVPSVTYNFKF